MLFKKYIGILKPFVFSFTKSDAIADELIQDSFIRVWLSRDKLPEIDSFKPWLFKIAANECYRYLRKELTENNAKARIHAKLVTEVNNQVNDHISIEEIKRIAGRTIDQLAPQRKKIYQMSRDRGMKIEEIAGELNLSPNTVKNVLVTTAKIVRASLEEAGYSLPLILFVHFY